jgi:hypothetical protein
VNFSFWILFQNLNLVDFMGLILIFTVYSIIWPLDFAPDDIELQVQVGWRLANFCCQLGINLQMSDQGTTPLPCH